MKKITALSLFLAAAIVAVPAQAGMCDHNPMKGCTLGLRAAYGLPLGTAAGNTDLKDLASDAVPIQIEANHRFSPHWEAGAYFGAGYVRIADEAKADLESQGATKVDGHRLQRVGIQGIYHILPQAKVAPWVGIGGGYGWTRYAEARMGGKDTEIGLAGWEAMVQAGGSMRVSSHMSLGPYASATVGQFRKHMVTVDDGEGMNHDIDDKGTHEWVELGIRGSFDL